VLCPYEKSLNARMVDENRAHPAQSG